MTIDDRGAHTLTLRLLPGPGDLNYNGHVSGAWILGHMDMAGGIVAYKRCGGPIVTVAVEGMVFLHPLLLGDLVGMHVELGRVGRTSMATEVEVWVERPGERAERLMARGRYIYVAVTKGQPRLVDPA